MIDAPQLEARAVVEAQDGVRDVDQRLEDVGEDSHGRGAGERGKELLAAPW